MRRKRWHGSIILAVVVLAGATLLACDGGATDPIDEGVPEDSLQFLMLPADLLPLVTMDTSFWAVRGQNTEFVLRYEPEAGETEGEEFLTFRIRDDGLYRKPDGSAFAEGDSIEIHLTLDESGRFIFDFQPSGLQFGPDKPAELEIEYRRLEGDLDGDGNIDDDDDDIEERIRLWKQESPGGPWYPIGTIRLKDTDEVRGEITSFTGFAVAV